MANWFVCRTVIVASMGALHAGLFIGSVNGMFEMNGFQNSFQELFTSSDNCSTSDLQCGRCSSTKRCSGGNGSSANSILGLMVSIGCLGAVLGSLLGGWSSSKLGRKMSLVAGGGLHVVGAAISGFAFYSWFFIIGRGLSGMGMGIIYVVMPVYISELSPKKSRGLLTSSIGPVYCMALLIAIGLNCEFAKFCHGWRMHMVIQVVVGFIYSIGMLFMPRTPRWLVLNKRNGEAHLVLSRINGSSLATNCIDTYLELEELKENTNTFASQNYFVNFARQMRKLLQWKHYQRFMLSLLLFMASGPIGNFTYYFAATFFCNLNITGCFPGIIVATFLLIGGCISFFFIDLVGRKLILLVSTPLLILFLVLVTSLTQVFNLEENSNESVGYVVVTLFCLYALIYSVSWVTIPWVISSEIFPVEARGTNVALTTAAYWICAYLSTQFVPLIINSVLGITGFFYILIGINVLSFMIPLLGLPETKGVSLEEMDGLFNKPWKQRINLVYYLSCGISKMNKATEPNDTKDSEDAMEYKQKEVL